MITRRNLLSLLPAFIAAPAIIRVADLMPIKAFDHDAALDNLLREYIAQLDARLAQAESDMSMIYWNSDSDILGFQEFTSRDFEYKVIKGPFEIVPLSTNPTT